MAFKLTRADGEILRTLAECRILTSPQLAALLSRSKKGMRDRIRKLISEGLLMEVARGRGQRRGRPERIISLAEPAVAILRERGLIDPQVSHEDIAGDSLRCQNHQLLLNWARIHLEYLETVVPRLKARFLAHNSPFLPPEFSRVSVPSAAGEVINFTPDATFSLCHAQGG